jgi:hypothetical protein
MKEIKQMISSEHKMEHERNLQIFLSLNQEEKSLRKELIDRQTESLQREKFS